MTLAYLALGSNLGDRKATLDAAVAALGETPGIVVRAVSSYHETNPIGGPGGQGSFLNAAATIETSLDPTDLLHRLHAIEAEAGRVRTVRWGERPIDLDLLLYGDRVIDTPELIVPHLRMGVRRFVLAPLAEIAIGVIDPISRLTASQALALLDRRPSYVAIFARADQARDVVFELVRKELDAEAVFPWGGPPEDTLELQGWRRSPWDDDWQSIPARLLESLPDHRADTGHWLISNFWADSVLLEHRLKFCPRSGPATALDLKHACDFEALKRLRDQLLPPTFVAVIHPAKTPLILTVDQIRTRISQSYIDRLGPEFTEAVLSYVEKVQRKSAGKLTPNCTALQLGPGEPGELAAEIVAACRASRA